MTITGLCSAGNSRQGAGGDADVGRDRYNAGMFARIWIFLCLGLASALACAAGQDMAALESLAKRFVETELAGQDRHISFGQLDRRLSLDACPDPQAAWANDRREGATGVLLSCRQPTWSLRLPVRVFPKLTRVVLKRPLPAGSVLKADDLQLESARATTAPAGTLSALEEAVGKTLDRSLGAGISLRRDMFRVPQIIRPQQKVRVMVNSGGFSVAGEGVALAGGGEGEIITVRMPGGRNVQGKIAADGSVTVAF